MTALQSRARFAHIELVAALRRLEIPDDLAEKVANRLPYKTAERLTFELFRIWDSGVAADASRRSAKR